MRVAVVAAVPHIRHHCRPETLAHDGIINVSTWVWCESSSTSRRRDSGTAVLSARRKGGILTSSPRSSFSKGRPISRGCILTSLSVKAIPFRRQSQLLAGDGQTLDSNSRRHRVSRRPRPEPGSEWEYMKSLPSPGAGSTAPLSWGSSVRSDSRR